MKINRVASPIFHWLDPKTVSFRNVAFGEGSCAATGATGIYVTSPPGNHSANGPVSITGGNSTTGCGLPNGTHDHAFSSCNPWGSGGTFTWSIPTQYIHAGTRYTFGSNQIHKPTLQANGDAEMAKGGQSGSATLNSATVQYGCGH